MKKTAAYILAFVFACDVSFAQNDPSELISAMAGASSIEEIDEDTAENYESLLSRKLAINVLPPARLTASGLFSRYQVASLTDYIANNGDVLSAAELCLVDGFDSDFVERLLPFISFYTSTTPGRSSLNAEPIDGEFSSRATAKVTEGASSSSYSAKLKLEGVHRFDAGLSIKSPYGSKGHIETTSACLTYHCRRYLNMVTVGDYHARFGQGLLMWSGFSLSGFSSAAAFARHPGGLSPAYTLSPSTARRGAAAELQFGRVVTSLMYDVSGFAAANATIYVRSGQLGATVLSDASASCDFRWNHGKLDYFGEVAYSRPSGSAAEIVGLTFNPAYKKRLSFLLRNYPSSYSVATASGPRSSTKTCDESGAALALDLPSWTFSLDVACHPSKGTSQTKIISRYNHQFNGWITADIKATARYRPQDADMYKLDLRPTFSIIRGSWLYKLSSVFSYCSSFSCLGCLEVGYSHDDGTGKKRRKLSAFARGTVFKVDSWDDRIYFYERDIPGAFSVPAYYGRGYSLSAVCTARWGRFSTSARIAMTDYPSMRDTKGGKLEAKMMLSFTL